MSSTYESHTTPLQQQTQQAHGLEPFIKSAHSLLYSAGTTGTNAMRDIMRMVTARVCRVNFMRDVLGIDVDEQTEMPIDATAAATAFELWMHQHHPKDKAERVQRNIDKLMPFVLEGIGFVDNSDTSFDTLWKTLAAKMLRVAYPELFHENDARFYCTNQTTLRSLAKRTGKFKLASEDADANIYEYFKNQYSGGGGKELGQFFTPPHLLQAILSMAKRTPQWAAARARIQAGETVQLYDPTMGTAGFLRCAARELLEDHSTSVFEAAVEAAVSAIQKGGQAQESAASPYAPGRIRLVGNEIDSDTAKFAHVNHAIQQLVSASGASTNAGASMDLVFRCGDTLAMSHSPEKAFDIIVANPPFGIKLNYDACLQKYEDAYAQWAALDSADERTDDQKRVAARSEFKQAHPIKMNDGGPGIFVQHCVTKLKKSRTGGVCAIVLPAGKLFEGASAAFKKLRKWLLETVNVRYVLHSPGGTFENAGVSTNTLVFTSDGPTTRTEFMACTDKTCADVAPVHTVTFAEFEANGNWSMDVGSYAPRPEEAPYAANVQMVALGEICTFQSGDTNTRDITNTGEYPYYRASASNPSGTHSSYCFGSSMEDTYLLFVKSGGNATQPISNTHGIGKTFLVTGLCSANSEVMKLKITNSHRVCVRYLYFAMCHFQAMLQALAKYSTNLGHITKEPLKAFKIPLPPIEVQRQIAEELTALVTHVDDLRRTTATARQLQQWHLRTVLRSLRAGPSDDGVVADDGAAAAGGGASSSVAPVVSAANGDEAHAGGGGAGVPMVALGDVCDVSGGKSITKAELKPGEVPVVGGGRSPLGTHDTSNVAASTVIVSKDGAYAGFVSRYECPVLVSGHGYYLTPTTQMLDNAYLFHTLKHFEKNLLAMQKGAGQPGIKRHDLKAFKIPLPPIDVQQQIAAELDAIYDSAKSDVASTLPRTSDVFNVMLRDPSGSALRTFVAMQRDIDRTDARVEEVQQHARALLESYLR